MHYAIVDIETTGGSPKSSKITEIAIYKHDGKEVIDEFVTLINPEMKIPEFIVRLTGISDKMVENSPKFYEIAKKIIEFTEGCIFVAHNVGFDYGILRHEFKSLGYDYRRPHLCTVRTSRYVIPGMESYSLGKLSRSLGIEIKGRHRAGGDALATAHLFTMLVEKDPGDLASFIQQEVNPKVLHPNLDLETLDEIPGKTGVYKFFNEVNQLIYIGKSKQIKNRVDQHLRNTKTKKGIQMIKEVMRIEYELTGSELIALLLESQLIKLHKPMYNRQLKKTRFPYGLFDYFDENGYHRLHIALTSTKTEIPLASFSTKKEGTSFLEYKCEEYQLCQKLCDLYPTQSACFHYTIKKCKGSCIQAEPSVNYNDRVDQLVKKLCLNGESFYIIDKGRHKSEKSIVLIERGTIVGFGFAPYHFNGQPPFKWKRYIDLISEDRDARTILSVFLRKHSGFEIVRI
ncbi:MAG: exonuclease domain-containing protein [Flavobacteriia bacterium]